MCALYHLDSGSCLDLGAGVEREATSEEEDVARRHGGYNVAIRTTDIRARDGSIRERATACNSTDDCRDRGGQVAGADRGAHERSSVCVVNSIIVQHAEVSIVRRAMVVCMKRVAPQIALRAMRRYVPAFG